MLIKDMYIKNLFNKWDESFPVFWLHGNAIVGDYNLLSKSSDISHFYQGQVSCVEKWDILRLSSRFK